ncbi:hypothetical protein [Sphaerisporangium fuscum]|uniref:hypothetical protein n=1 Tax=Sphaerisporangium fuscum TaxID=2835868 RepID=UPI001BDD7C52|nr:hypothetical protein [Sphaerisporangium fuscum]
MLVAAAAVAGVAFATVGAGTAASAAAAHAIHPWAAITDSHGDALAEAELTDKNTIIICDRSTDHRYAMAKVRYGGHTYQYANYYKNQDCFEQKTKNFSHGKVELWACVSKPYKVKFARCGAKTTFVR